MALITELLSNIILLVTRPFALLRLSCVFIIRIALVVICTWTELVWATIRLHFNLIWGTISWTIGIVSLPARLVNALQRERQMEQQLQELQDELENLLWDQKELQEHLQIAVRERKERKMMESVLAELEEEHDMAIAKIVELESKLQDLTNENRRLQEIQGKAYWSSKDQDQNISDYDNPHSALPWKSNYSGSGIALQNLIMTKDIWEDESKSKTEVLKLLKTGSKSGTCPPVRHETISREVKTREVVDHRRAAALSQSLFSALLSLLVGVTVWKAQEPCMPLVVALFTVVIMSLRSVVQFFSTIKNKPASDAVALLSLNWFVLGTLTYPTLPRFAHMFAPTLSSLLDQAISRLGGLFFS